MKSWNAERGQGWFEHPSLSRSGLPWSLHRYQLTPSFSHTTLHTNTHKSLPSLTPAFTQTHTQEPSFSHTSLHTNTHTRAFLLHTSLHTNTHTRAFLLSHQPSHKHTHKSLPSLTHFLLPLFLPSISGCHACSVIKTPLIFFYWLIRPQTSFLLTCHIGRILLLEHLFFFVISS